MRNALIVLIALVLASCDTSLYTPLSSTLEGKWKTTYTDKFDLNDEVLVFTGDGAFHRETILDSDTIMFPYPEDTTDYQILRTLRKKYIFIMSGTPKAYRDTVPGLVGGLDTVANTVSNLYDKKTFFHNWEITSISADKLELKFKPTCKICGELDGKFISINDSSVWHLEKIQ
jgi:hypothetical protein